MVSIATPRQDSLPLSHFYRETDGNERLSQNLASNELFTPLVHDRITVSPAKSVLNILIGIVRIIYDFVLQF